MARTDPVEPTYVGGPMNGQRYGRLIHGNVVVCRASDDGVAHRYELVGDVLLYVGEERSIRLPPR